MLQIRLCKDEYFFDIKYTFMTQWVNLDNIKIKYLDDFTKLIQKHLNKGYYIEYRTI